MEALYAGHWFRPFGRGTLPQSGDFLTMVINHLQVLEPTNLELYVDVIIFWNIGFEFHL